MNNSESQLFCGEVKIDEVNNQTSNNSNSVIKLFKIELAKYVAIVDVLFKTLSTREQERAHRFRQLKDSHRFVICRSLLKFLIANETGLNISHIFFELNDNNKPYFNSDSPLFFNVSHSGDYAIIALGKCELGVDIEYIDKNFDFNEILPTVYNKIEINEINNSENKSYSFYKFWTRKEAIVKAIGKGIDDDVSKIPATDGLHSVSSDLLSDFKNINVFSFNVTQDYLGAIALTENTEKKTTIQYYQLPESDELVSLLKTT